MITTDNGHTGRKVYHRSLLTLAVCIATAATAITARAQSTNRDNPTPLVTNVIKGAGTGAKIEYYYSFGAGPGQVVLTIDLKAKAGATQEDVELFDATGNKIFYYYPNATAKNERAIKHFMVADKQTLLLRLALDSSAGDYAVRLGGAVDLAVDKSPGPTVPNQSTDGLADLVVSQIAFDQSPSKIRVRVMNSGNGPSTVCHLALQSLTGNDPTLPTTKRVWTIEIPALEAGKGYSNVIDVSPLTQNNGPWKASVDRSNEVKESNEANNSLTYPTGDSGPVSAAGLLPDLVITKFTLRDPDTGVVAVVVKNIGQGDAGACTLRLIVWEPGQFERKDAKTVFLKVGSIAAQQSVAVRIRAGVPIINAKYSMFIDISEEVVESNENNNRAEGDAGGL